ncbi:MAG: type II toxin-antitoxin system HigB family toxin [Acidobacteriota bacterium]
MRIISKKPLREFWQKHADAERLLREWHKHTLKADWGNLSEVRKDFPSADPFGLCVVFNIGGNKYRLVVRIIFRLRKIYVRSVMTHEEYNRGGWKNGCVK